MNLIKRLTEKVLYGLTVILGVVSLIFFLFNVLPGDPASMMMVQRADMITVEVVRK